MLFEAKLAEVRQHIVYLQNEFARCRQHAHRNLAGRLEIRLNDLAVLQRDAAELGLRLAQYEANANPAIDTWPQLFSELRSLAVVVQLLRTEELPAYLSEAPDDEYLSNVLETLHRELGFNDVQPVVSLHQGYWFGAKVLPASHPLYFVPASLAFDPGELALVFHEIGHLLFSHWSPEFPERVWEAVAESIHVKSQSIQVEADPTIRQEMSTALTDWTGRAETELEEVVCDIVGTLLGGPAFLLAATMGLLAASVAPFEAEPPVYPPLECRIRASCVILRQFGLADQMVDTVEAEWNRACATNITEQPRWYRWLYDDVYFSRIATVVHSELTRRGILPYGANVNGLRADLTVGAIARVNSLSNYEDWTLSMAATLRRDFAPSSSTSSQSSSSSSPSNSSA